MFNANKKYIKGIFNMTSISELRKNKNNLIQQLQKDLEKVVQKSEPLEDPRFWSPKMDKSKNTSAIIRFLPAPKGENSPFVKYFSHSFQGPTGKYYIENCLTSIGKDDPVCQANKVLWDSGTEVNKKLAQDRKRKTHFISNILVVKDPANPENNGKVFLYRYGKKIFEKIQTVISPVEDDLGIADPKNPFDFWEGMNFVLRVHFADGYYKYDNSAWLEPSELIPGGSDEDYESVWNQCHSLVQFLDPSNYKSFEELQKRLSLVLASSSSSSVSSFVEATSLESSDEVSDSLESELSDEDEVSDIDFMKKLAAKANL